MNYPFVYCTKWPRQRRDGNGAGAQRERERAKHSREVPRAPCACCALLVARCVLGGFFWLQCKFVRGAGGPGMLAKVVRDFFSPQGGGTTTGASGAPACCPVPRNPGRFVVEEAAVRWWLLQKQGPCVTVLSC